MTPVKGSSTFACDDSTAPAGLTPRVPLWLLARAVDADRPMTAWHPLTKLLVACGTLAIGWLLVSGPSEAPATVAVARSRPAVEATAITPDATLAALAGLSARLDLPPREAFRAMVERPLFTPARRPASPPLPVVAAESEAETIAESGSAEPPFRLVGTVSRRGRSEALVALEGGRELARLEAGSELAGWVVVEIGPDHLEVERDGERRRMRILH